MVVTEPSDRVDVIGVAAGVSDGVAPGLVLAAAPVVCADELESAAGVVCRMRVSGWVVDRGLTPRESTHSRGVRGG